MEIRLVRQDELGMLQTFLHEHWKANHILATNKTLMDFQHFNGTTYNFVIAIENGRIFVALGFIPTFQFDEDIKETDIWLAIWKKSHDCPKGLGVKCLDWLEEAFIPRTIGAIGINDNIEQLYLSRGWHSGVLNHYVFQPHSRLCTIKENNTTAGTTKFYATPAKSETYIKNRYIDHPFYHYDVHKVQNATIVTRRIQVDWVGSCTRIIEIFGDIPVYADAWLSSFDTDYIDCLNWGIPPEAFYRMGMHLKSEGVIYPNWFEPFSNEEHKIKFAFKGKTRVCGGDCFTPYVIWKGDSDQDRPNMLKKAEN